MDGTRLPLPTHSQSAAGKGKEIGLRGGGSFDRMMEGMREGGSIQERERRQGDVFGLTSLGLGEDTGPQGSAAAAAAAIQREREAYQGEIDDIVASECILCGEHMIQEVAQPFCLPCDPSEGNSLLEQGDNEWDV